ncbi:TdeIII family type II restriction endonuclease [bacterium]|mgnify:CR=1 FL=1|jgi:hypothetical protein|nr:TdeIII family type II restriction endonuclease [bacterium]MBT4894994.1 TdeIII family type II restriction endonuclease [bacterium]
MNDLKKEKIAIETIKVLRSRFESFPEDSSNNRNAPFHEAFIGAFRDKFEENQITDISYLVSLSSWLHGLSTTLGQNFFENTAFILSDGYKKGFTEKENNRLQITQGQKNAVDEIFTDLKNSNNSPNLNEENEIILGANNTSRKLEAKDFTVDVFIESDDTILAVELKSVKPNKGEMGGEKHKILEAKAALQNTYPNKTISYFIGFPFDPTDSDGAGYDKSRFLNNLIDGKRYFAEDETLVAEELWTKLSGENDSMSIILEIINKVATPEFMNKYNYILDYEKRTSDPEGYEEQLQEWMLYREIRLFNNSDKIINAGENIIRKFNKPLFKKNGEYDMDRYSELEEIINH